jgi:hypothetical protein
VDDGRRDYSLKRLSELGERLQPVGGVVASRPLCAYATGSYGRLEAGPASDIDLFFLCDAGFDDQFPFTIFVRLAAAIVEATEAMGFPPFTGDGQYLEVHYIQRMEDRQRTKSGRLAPEQPPSVTSVHTFERRP